MEFISTQPSEEIARRLGITDRQARRIKQGLVSPARLREHAKADPKHLKKPCRPYPARGAGGTFSFSSSAYPPPTMERTRRSTSVAGFGNSPAARAA